MSSFQFRIAFAAAALTAAIVLPALPLTAHAGDDNGSTRVASARLTAHVDFADPHQVDGVYHRLQTQARYVCDVAASYDKDYDTRAERACEADAMAGAVHDINQPQLSRLDAEKSGKAPIELSLNSPVH